jgi:hypothetical protein
MINEICYFNDENRTITVRVMDQRYDPVHATGDIYVTLEPCEMRVFEVHMPSHHILFVKKWEKMLMISHIDPTALAQLREPRPSKDAA